MSVKMPEKVETAAKTTEAAKVPAAGGVKPAAEAAKAPAATETAKPAKAAKKARKPASKAKAAAKTAAKMEKPAAKAVKEPKKSVAKTKAVSKTTRTKSAAKTAKASSAVKVYLEYLGKQMDMEAILEAVKAAAGVKRTRSMEVYVKPEDGAAYYVINGKKSGKAAL